MVRFDPNLEPDDARVRAMIEQANGRVHHRFLNARGLMEVHVPPGRAAETIRAWGESPLVWRVGPSVNFELQRTPPDDSRFNLQWGHRTFAGQQVGPHPQVFTTLGADARVYEAWAVTTDGSAKVIAVVDAGVYWMHPEFEGQMWVNPGEGPGNEKDDDDNGIVDDVHGAFFSYDPPCWPFWPDKPGPPPPGDPTTVTAHFGNAHGTRVASIIGAVPNNELDLAGICWGVQIMALRIDHPHYSGQDCEPIESGPLVLAAVDYAITHGASIINLSYAAQDDIVGLNELFQKADEKGILIVVAAGNTAGDIDDQEAPGWESLKKYPAVYGHENLIVAAASNVDDTIAAYSNWGAESVDITAPGTHMVILSDVDPAPPNYDYNFQPSVQWDSGTSFAAPYVAGVAALAGC